MSAWTGPGTREHDYSPDIQAMGDFRVCGHMQEDHSPWREHAADNEARKDAWSDFEGEHLTDGGGNWVRADIVKACREAFEQTWPQGRQAALESAGAAFRRLAHPAPEQVAEASGREGERADIIQWQTEQSEFFQSNVLEVVTEYAEWRDRQAAFSTKAEPADIAFGALWTVITDDHRVHEARRTIGIVIGAEGRARGVAWAVENLPQPIEADILRVAP